MTEIDKVIAVVLVEAERMRLNAAYAGELDDGGAGSLMEQVKFYQYGMKNVLPKEWEKYAELLDPEYKEYLRLKEKFKGR